MARLASFRFILACLLCPPLGGQEPQVPNPGFLVRVTAPHCSLDQSEVVFRAANRGSLFVRDGNTDFSCPMAAVDRMEVFKGRSRWGGAATSGILIGGAAGVLAGASMDPRNWLAGLGAGAVLGAALGRGPQARRWTLWGSLVGLVGGAVGGALACQGDREYGPWFCAGVFGACGAPIGALAGSVTALVRGEERWEEVPLSSFGLAAQLTP